MAHPVFRASVLQEVNLIRLAFPEKDDPSETPCGDEDQARVNVDLVSLIESN
jgi:hypothetical protein